MPGHVSELTVRRQTGIERKKQAKAARKRQRLRGSRRPKRLSAKQKALVRKRKASGFFKKAAKLRSSLDLPATIVGSISHRTEYIDMILEVAAGFEDEKQSAREFAKLFIEKDPAFSNTDTGMAAILFEAYLFEKGEDVVEQFLETQLEGSDTTFLAIFEGKIKEEALKKLIKGVQEFCTVETLVIAGDTNHEGGEVSDVTILECTPKRGAASKARKQTKKPEPEIRTEGLLPVTKADYEAVIEDGGITDNAFMYLYPHVWEAATGTNGDIRIATESTGVKWYCNEGVWVPDPTTLDEEEDVETSVDEAYMLTTDIKVKGKKFTKGKTVKVLKKTQQGFTVELIPGVETHVLAKEIKKFSAKPPPNEDITEGFEASFSDSTRANRFAREIRVHARTIRPKGTQVYYEVKEGDHTQDKTHSDTIEELCKKHGGKKKKAKKQVKEEEDTHAFVAGPFLGDGSPRLIHNGSCEVIGFPTALQDGPLYLESEDGFQSKFRAWTVRKEGTDDGKVLVHVGSQMYRLPATLSEVKGLLDKMEEFYEDLPDEFDTMIEAFLQEYCEEKGTRLCHEDVVSMGLHEALEEWTSHEFIATRDTRIAARCRMRRLAMGEDLDTVSTLHEAAKKYAIRTEKGAQARVLSAIRKKDKAAKVDPEKNPITAWVTTKLSVADIEKMPGVEDVILATKQEDLDEAITKAWGQHVKDIGDKHRAEFKRLLKANKGGRYVGYALDHRGVVHIIGTKEVVGVSPVPPKGDELTVDFVRMIHEDDLEGCAIVSDGAIDESTFSAMVGGFNIGTLMRVGEKATTKTVKCPGCDGKVLAATGYCVKCKKKTVTEEGLDEVKVTKVKSAVKTHVPGVTVGATTGGKTVIFLSADYDNKGTVKGAVEDVSNVKGAFYLLSMKYDDAALKKLGYKSSDRDALVNKAKAFKRKTEPAESLDEAKKQEPTEDNISNYIRDTLSGTERRTTPELLFGGAKGVFKGLTKKQFMAAWNSLVRERYLKKVGKQYMWESIEEAEDRAYYEAKVMAPLVTEAAKHGLTLEKIRMGGEYQAFKVLKGKSLVGFLMQTGKNTADEEHPWKAFGVSRGKVGEKIGFFYKRDGGKSAALQAIAKTGLESEDDETTLDEQLNMGDGVEVLLPKGSKDYDSVTSVQIEVDNNPVAKATRKAGTKKWALRFTEDVSGSDKKKATAGIRDFHLKYVESIGEAVIGTYRQTSGIPDMPFKIDVLAVRKLPDAIRKRTTTAQAKGMIQVKVKVLGKPRWINADYRDVTLKGNKSAREYVGESIDDYEDLGESRISKSEVRAKLRAAKIAPVDYFLALKGGKLTLQMYKARDARKVDKVFGRRAKMVKRTFPPTFIFEDDLTEGKSLTAKDAKKGLRIVSKSNPEWGVWVMKQEAKGIAGSWEIDKASGRGSKVLNAGEFKFWRLADVNEQLTMKVAGVGKVKEPTHMKALARKAGKSGKKALELWGRAQARANEQYPELKAAVAAMKKAGTKGGQKVRRYYKVVTAIFKNMLGLGKEECEQSDPIIAEMLCHSCRSATEVLLYPHSVGICGECGSVHVTPTGELHYATEEECVTYASDAQLQEAVTIGTPPDMMLKWHVMEAQIWTENRAEARKAKRAVRKHFGDYDPEKGMYGGLMKGLKVGSTGFTARVVVSPAITAERFLGGLKDAIIKGGLQGTGIAFEEAKNIGTVSDLDRVQE